MIESTGLILERGAPAYAPNFPYAASKAASIIWRAYHYTYGLCTTTTNCFNNYNPPIISPEMLIPRMIVTSSCPEAGSARSTTSEAVGRGQSDHLCPGRSGRRPALCRLLRQDPT